MAYPTITRLGGNQHRFASRRNIRWFCAGLVLGVFLVLASLVYMFNPSETPIFPTCLFHSLTGIYCPGCGMTRALHQIMHGHVWAAFCMNPLIILLLPAVLAGAVWNYFRYGSLLSLPVSGKVGWLMLWLIVGFSVARSIPVYPFILLAPHLPK